MEKIEAIKQKIEEYYLGEKTKEELKPLLDNPEVIVLDVRLLDEWKRGDLKIKGAVREDPEKDYRTWASKYSKDKTLVFYCS